MNNVLFFFGTHLLFFHFFSRGWRVGDFFSLYGLVAEICAKSNLHVRHTIAGGLKFLARNQVKNILNIFDQQILYLNRGGTSPEKKATYVQKIYNELRNFDTWLAYVVEFWLRKNGFPSSEMDYAKLAVSNIESRVRRKKKGCCFLEGFP